MAIQKTYVTWMSFWVKGAFAVHPTSTVERNWSEHFTWEENITDKGTSINGTGIDHRHLAVLSWDDSTTNSVKIQDFKTNMGVFAFKQKTVNEALALANTWYPVKSGDEASFPDGYFELDTDNFTIIDNRPVDSPI